MTDCVVCRWIEEKKNVLFEDGSVFVMLSPEPASPGHMLIIPKKHAPILEAIPNDVVGALFSNANKASVCAFESLGAQGTNLLVQNGLPAGQKLNHAFVQVVPRFQDDNVPLGWEPSQLSKDQLDELESKFKAAVPAPDKVEQEISADDYRVEALRRIP